MQAQKIQAYLLKNISQHPHDIVRVTMTQFDVSRTTVLRHLSHLINAGKVIKTGNTKQTTYALTNSKQQKIHLKLNQSFDEFEVFNTYIQPIIKPLVSNNTFDIAEYSATEILNNAKDHSKGTALELSISLDSQQLRIRIKDNGIGALENLKSLLKTDDAKETILQLSKGKLTSDPKNHTGEGVFFSSRACQCFTLTANGYSYIRDNIERDWSLVTAEKSPGTDVLLEIKTNSDVNLVELFQHYQDPDSLAFMKTDVFIAMAREHGQRLISRSQAKRVVKNLDQFSHVTLDFKHVEAIGQGFADQVFRVFKQQHPNVTLHAVNASETVDFMIKRTQASL